jgi:hypothetical protein
MDGEVAEPRHVVLAAGGFSIQPVSDPEPVERHADACRR